MLVRSRSLSLSPPPNPVPPPLAEEGDGCSDRTTPTFHQLSWHHLSLQGLGMGDQHCNTSLSADLVVKLSKELFPPTPMPGASAVFTYIEDISVKWGNISDPPQFLRKQCVPASPQSHQSQCLQVVRDEQGQGHLSALAGKALILEPGSAHQGTRGPGRAKFTRTIPLSNIQLTCPPPTFTRHEVRGNTAELS